MSNRIDSTNRTGHAIVIGGSIAGLLTARVLTNHFARVTVIERDELPDAPAFRKGTPHARHPHALLVRGQQIMEALFPGLTEELWAQGAISANMGADLALYIGGIGVKPYPCELTATMCSRPLLEHPIYSRLRASPQVHFLDGQDVAGLCTDRAGRRVTGVRLHKRGTPSQPELAADLVVDTSGRGSKLPLWLEALGYTPPTETTVDAQAGYATRIYRRSAATTPWKALYGIPQAPQQSRGCLIMAIEGDRWHVTLTGFNGDFPPTDEAGFLAFARSVPVPDCYAAIAAAEPLTDPYGYRGVANRLRHYDHMPRYLEGLLAVGDAVCAFNPVYGQGMTVAALGALTLDECLYAHRRRHTTDDQTGLARRFQKQLARVNAGPWQMATGQDLRWPIAATGHKTDPITRAIQHYFDRVLATMANNAEVAEAFTQVQNMLKSPATLFHPRILWQVLRAGQTRAPSSLLTRPQPSMAQKVGIQS